MNNSNRNQFDTRPNINVITFFLNIFLNTINLFRLIFHINIYVFKYSLKSIFKNFILDLHFEHRILLSRNY